MDLDELKAELQKYKDLRDKAIKDGADFGWINDIIADYEAKINAIQPAAADPVLEEIILPTDYNAIFGDPRANEEITNLIRQVKAQIVTDHRLEIERIFEANKQNLAELQADHEIQIKQITIEKLDAEPKRDNAIELKEAAEDANAKLLQEKVSLNGQINELEGLLRNYKKPAASHGLSLTTSLKPETDEEKQARLAKEKTDLINQNLSRFNIAPLPTKEDLVTTKQLDDSFRSVAEGATVVSDDTGGDRIPEAAEVMEPAEDGSGKNTIEQQLREDVALLQKQMSDVMYHLELK